MYLILFVVGCTSEFTSIDQAKNEVNKQGYREGRWVDYFDSLGLLVSDKSKGYSNYCLSEYENGIHIGNTKLYGSKGDLLRELTHFQDRERLKKNSDPLTSINSSNEFDIEGKLTSTNFYNQNKEKIRYMHFGYKNDVRDTSFDINYTYKKNGFRLSEHGSVLLPNGNKLKFKITFSEVAYWAFYEFAKGHPEFKTEFEKVINDRGIGPLLLNDDLGIKQEKPYGVEYFILGNDTLFVMNIAHQLMSKYLITVPSVSSYPTISFRNKSSNYNQQSYRSKQWENCSRCGGQGKIVCRKCNGTTLQFCGTCGGRGTWAGDQTCYYCKGALKVKCTECYGSGIKENRCRDCNGSGQIQR